MKKSNIIICAGIAVGAGLAAAAIALHCRRSIPKGVEAVSPFDANRYLGKWYEIARFDFRFEKNLEHVTAHYSLREDGSIHVVNRGYDTRNGEWKESVGRAVFAGDPSTAMLKVSFFGPFYAGYNVVAIDPEYKYALVVGRNLDYLWLLSREEMMPDEVVEKYLAMAESIGFDLDRLHWTEQ